jgi:hypothetical protein
VIILTYADLLEATVVTPTGKVKTLNKYSDPDHFWALRGGGGCSWGVIVHVTYRTHPLPKHIQVVFFQANASTPAARRTVYIQSLAALADIADAGYTGYIDAGIQFQGIFNRANGTNETYLDAFSSLSNLSSVEGVSAAMGPFEFPDFSTYSQSFLKDPNIATNVIDASRLLTADVLRNKGPEIYELIERYPELGAGFNFGKFVILPAQKKSVLMHPSGKSESDRTKQHRRAPSLGRQPRLV